MFIGITVIVMIVGLLIYALCKDGKLAEIGRILFAFGLLALLLNGDKVIALIR